MTIEQINSLLSITIAGNTLGQYLQAILTMLVVFLGSVLVQRLVVKYLGRLAARTIADFDNFLVRVASRIGWFVFFVVAFYFGSLNLILPLSVAASIRNIAVIVVTIRAVLVVEEILKYGLSMMYRHKRAKDDPAIEAMVASLTGLLRWIIWSLALLFVLDNLGVNITTLVAGIGIGGIAVAMASQAILGDAFSAFSILLDKPFEIGDFIIVDDIKGTVEHIGIKTTRIRSLSGEQLIVANSDLTKSRIKNYKRMEKRRAAFNFNLSYKTPPEKLRHISKMVREILEKKKVKVEYVNFMNFGTSSFVFEAVYYLDSADYGLYLNTQEEVNLALLEKLAQEGIELAYPAQIVYVEQGNQKGEGPQVKKGALYDNRHNDKERSSEGQGVLRG